MADKAEVTPEAEIIAPPEATTETKVEGTVEAILPKVEAKAEPKVVPEAVFLSLKKELKDLKQEIKDAKESQKPAMVIEGLKDLAEKYPDVNQDFLKDLLAFSSTTASKKIEELQSQQDDEKRQIAFDKAFDNLFDKTLEENPELPRTIDKDAIKALALTPKYRNTPLAEILQKMYPATTVGKASSENDMRSAADKVDDIVSFDKITPDQKKAIMADPTARQHYFNWLDKQPG